MRQANRVQGNGLMGPCEIFFAKCLSNFLTPRERSPTVLVVRREPAGWFFGRLYYIRSHTRAS